LGKSKKFSPASDPKTPCGAEKHLVTEALAFLSSDRDADGNSLFQHPSRRGLSIFPIPSGGSHMPDLRFQHPGPAKKNEHRRRRWGALTFASCLVLADEVFAQAGGDPWTQATQALQTAFTGPIATGLALVAIVVGGLMFAFGEGGARRTLAGVVFGVGMAVGAVNFMAWLFP
jgi:type IV secretory pathway VirB2 component (pilin)